MWVVSTHKDLSKHFQGKKSLPFNDFQSQFACCCCCHWLFCVGEVVMVLPTQLTMERHSNFTIKLFDRFQKKRGAMFSIFHGKEASWALRASHKNPISRTVNTWQQHPPVDFRRVLLGEEPLRAGKKNRIKANCRSWKRALNATQKVAALHNHDCTF